MKGFIAFYKGNKEEALKNYATMKKYDEMNRIYESQGDWGDYKRLVWGAEHGFFYATPSELARFGQKFRFPVLVGDFFYITEQFAKSADIYRRILAGELGSPPKILQAYSIYMIGSKYYWDQNYVAVVEKWKESAKLAKNSYTGERAMFAAGQRMTSYMGKNLTKEQRESYRREGVEILRYLAMKSQTRLFAINSQIALSDYSYRMKGKAAAISELKKFKVQNKEEEERIKAYIWLYSNN